jgi:hypothetical protein
MAEKPQPQQHTTDPDSVPETYCDGKFNISVHPPLATITFTTERPDASALIDHGRVETKAIVRSRIVMRLENLVALRDLLNRIIQENPPAGTSRH